MRMLLRVVFWVFFTSVLSTCRSVDPPVPSSNYFTVKHLYTQTLSEEFLIVKDAADCWGIAGQIAGRGCHLQMSLAWQHNITYPAVISWGDGRDAKLGALIRGRLVFMSEAVLEQVKPFLPYHYMSDMPASESEIFRILSQPQNCKGLAGDMPLIGFRLQILTVEHDGMIYLGVVSMNEEKSRPLRGRLVFMGDAVIWKAGSYLP